MSKQQGVEKIRVAKAVKKYFEGKVCTYSGFGRYTKEMLSLGTGIYAIEVKVKEWSSQHYALVLVARANVQGVIVLDHEEIMTITRMLDRGLGEQF